MDKKEIGIYIHIPFCRQKCYYCDFLSFCNEEEKIEKYIKCLVKEIKKAGSENKLLSENGIEEKYLVKTIYIGGGTPSILDKRYVGQIINTIKNNFQISKKREISIEINPGTIDKEKLEYYKKIGINRLSFGLQTTKNKLLKEIGRIHTYREFEKAYKLARNIGFKNINIDLLIGLPKQKIEDVKDSLKKIASLNPEHISVYSLILEENTKLFEMIQRKEKILPEDEEERQMYWFVRGYLKKNDYNHYEISNFSKKGYECKHNIDCWNQKEYLGFGVGASSFLNDVRFSNTNKLEIYMNNIDNENYSKNINLDEKLSLSSKMDEYMILGLRKLEGVSIKKFTEKFKLSPIFVYLNTIEYLEKNELIRIKGDRIFLSNKGIDFANIVWEEFLD